MVFHSMGGVAVKYDSLADAQAWHRRRCLLPWSQAFPRALLRFPARNRAKEARGLPWNLLRLIVVVCLPGFSLASQRTMDTGMVCLREFEDFLADFEGVELF